MRTITLITLFAFFLSSCANNTPNYNGITPKNLGVNRCGLHKDEMLFGLAGRYRGDVNGTIDEDGDNEISPEEAFSTWDFNQLTLVLESGIEWDSYVWTNIDTCYKFTMIPGEFYEDSSQGLLWKTCRDFAYKVKNNKGVEIGRVDKNTACRNFGTHQWIVM
jgi:hypothetical protein